MACFKMIGKEMTGSGFGNVLEARTNTAGSVIGVMNGKN